MLRSLLAPLFLLASCALAIVQDDLELPFAIRPDQPFEGNVTISPKRSSTKGVIPFAYSGNNYLTWFKIFGDTSNRSQTPLIVLHGGPGLTHDYLVPLEDITKATSRPVVLYDQIGNGHSFHIHDQPESFWTIDLFIDELENLLMHLGIEEFDILGHSWGGQLGAEFELRRQPAGLKHLILSNSHPDQHLWSQSVAQLEKKFPKEVRDALKAGPHVDREKYLDALHKFNAVHVCTVTPTPKELEYSILQMFGENGDMTVADAMAREEMRHWSIVDQLHRIRVPTFVINGRADMGQDFVHEPFFRYIPKVKWVTFQNSSHTPMWEERQRYMKLVADFLEL